MISFYILAGACFYLAPNRAEAQRSDTNATIAGWFWIFLGIIFLVLAEVTN